MKRLPAIVCGLCLVAVSSFARAEIEVVDDTDRRVVLERPAQRIVSLAPHVTELLFDAGAGDRVVAAVNYSDHPPEARDLPRVGSYNRFDLERILEHDPDLVVGWKSGNPDDSLARLERLGLTLYITEPRSLESIAGNLERLGRLAGTSEAAETRARQFRERYRELTDRYADRPKLRVFYEIWNDPLMTVNGDHLISAIMHGCGGENVFDGLPEIAPRIGVEAVLARDPEVVIASGMGDERPEWLDEWKDWPELEATRRGNLFFIPPQFLQRHTPRVLEGMEQMCLALEKARE